MNIDVIFDKIIDILSANNRDTTDIQKKVNKNGSISINIYKNLAFKITIKTKKYINVKKEYQDLFIDANLDVETIKSEPNFIRYIFYGIEDIDRISNIILTIYDECEASVHKFGCCSRYEECSNAMKCIHPNLMYAQGCWYRKNLEDGKIFYGIHAGQTIKNDTNKIETQVETIQNNYEQLTIV